MEELEIWMDIKDFEGLYQISNLGKVKSLDKIGWNNNKIKGRILKPSNNRGYLRVSLYKNGKANNWFYVSRLVAETFIPNLDNLPEVNHKNLNKSDNRVENLEWVSKMGNMEHAKINGVIPSGEDTFKCKLTWNEVALIRKEYLENKYASCLNLGKKYNVSKGVIRTIILNKNWYNKEYQNIIESDEFKNRHETATCKGELNHTAKLKECQVLEIRESHKNGESRDNILKRFNISRNHMNLIIRRGTWKHI